MSKTYAINYKIIIKQLLEYFYWYFYINGQLKNNRNCRFVQTVLS